MARVEPRTLKGFRDYSAAEQFARQAMFQKIQTVFEQFGFSPLSTPVLEYKEILMGKIGEDEKLIYSFKDNGGREVAMRYDLTVSLARYVAQNQGQLTFPFRRYQIAPVWRADNPQKGRLGEFYQCDVDIVGTNSPLGDVEVITCLCKALESLGVTNYRVRLNNRKIFEGFSQDTIRAIDKIDKIGVDGIVLEMKQKDVPQDEIDKAVALVNQKEARVPSDTSKLIELVTGFGIKGEVEFDPSIARGLDYYTSTVFEIFLNDKPEYGSICSGGRYDNLVDQFSEQSLPAVGGSIGIDRLYGALEELGLLPRLSTASVLVLNLESNLLDDYLALASQLREAGIQTELFYETTKLDKQFKYAERKGLGWAVILGSEEKTSGKLKLKNLQNREQIEVSRDELIGKIKR